MAVSTNLHRQLANRLNNDAVAELVDTLSLHDGPGARYYVDSGVGNDSNAGTDWSAPLSTINAASAKCTANNGDYILVAPGHTETVSAAAGLVLGVAGVTVIGLGHGAARPTIDFDTATTADMDVDAANVRMVNFLFTGGIDALAGPIDVNAADFTLEGCEWRDVTGQATDVIVADANADRIHIKDFRFDGATAAGANAGIALTGMDRPVIDGLWMDGNFAVGGIDIRTTAVTDLEVRNVIFRTRNAADIFLVDTITGSTGLIGPNIFMRLNDDAANVAEAVTGATFVVFDWGVHVVNAANEKSLAINWTATSDAIV